MTDGSLDFGQGKDVFHPLCHFGACEIFDLRGKALNRAAQIAKAVGAFGAFRLSPDTSFCSPDAPACAVPVQAASQLVLFQLGVVQGFSLFSFCLTSFFEKWG